MNRKSRQLPEFLRPYFWDVKFETVNPTKNPEYVLGRVLDLGNTKAVRWALSYFSKEDIIHLLKTSRDLSRKTANFWADILEVDKKEVPCLQKPYSRIPFGPSSE